MGAAGGRDRSRFRSWRSSPSRARGWPWSPTQHRTPRPPSPSPRTPTRAWTLSRTRRQEVPGVYTDAVAKLHKTARNLMVLKGIPWFIQATLSDEGFVSMEDLATRWDSPDRARETAPGELGFAPNNHHYTDVTSRLIAARMFQVVHAAGPGPHTPGDTAPNLTVSCERGQLERVWEEKTKLTKPKLALQGSDQLVKRQFKLCAGGEIGFIPMKYLVSALPKPGERPWKTTKKSTVDGWDREDEVEERGEPKTRHQLERMHAVFRNTLLMCVLSFPQFGQFDITRENLESWYEWFYGEDIGGRFPPPEDHVLAIAERNACQGGHAVGQAGHIVLDT